MAPGAADLDDPLGYVERLSVPEADDFDAELESFLRGRAARSRTMSDAPRAVPAVTHAHLRRDAVAALTAYRPAMVRSSGCATTTSHLTIHPDGVAKAGPPIHLTASCLVVEQSARRAADPAPPCGTVVPVRWHLEASDASLWAPRERAARSPGSRR